MNRVPIAALLLAAAWSAFAQTFPAKPVKIVSPYPAGLTPDIAVTVPPNQQPGADAVLDAALKALNASSASSSSLRKAA